ncbi:MAG: hypothetical protein ACJAXM_000202 [Arenicella sp.]|jgi:hypothetical protein
MSILRHIKYVRPLKQKMKLLRLHTRNYKPLKSDKPIAS